MERFDFDDILNAMLNTFSSNISDLIFAVNKPMQVEHSGNLMDVPVKPALAFTNLSPYQTAQIALLLIADSERLLKSLVHTGSCDLAYQLRNISRFRVNIFSTKKNFSLVLRRLETKVPTFMDLKAPSIFSEIVKEKNGLVLVTGSTGSGKSTTLAAMLRSLNENKSIHIVTLEDPIEFSHENIMATFNQRELGSDFDSFPNGLKAALRQAPKVILVGEMRDRETMEIALSAAETGHLVMSTLHTVNAGQTINRIIGMFDKEQEEQIRIRLADTLRWVVCQRLLKKADGGRVAAHEIMGNNLRVAEIILNGEDEVKTYFNAIESAEALGWQTFESCLLNLYSQGTVVEEEIVLNSTRKSVMRQKIDFVKNMKGEKTTDVENLQIDANYIYKLAEKNISEAK
jgi:twitching motility protein PilT